MCKIRREARMSKQDNVLYAYTRQNETFFSNYVLHVITQINPYDSIYLSIQ